MAARKEFWINNVLVPVGISVGTWLVTAFAQYKLLQYQMDQVRDEQAGIARQQRVNTDRLTKVEAWIETANRQRDEMLQLLTEIRRDARETRDTVQRIQGQLEKRGMIEPRSDSSALTVYAWYP